MKKSAWAVVAFIAMTGVAFATDAVPYYWGSNSVDGLSGSFNDKTHWFSDSGCTTSAGNVPNVNAFANVYPPAGQGMTLQFPDGENRNFARFWAQVFTNSEMSVECLNGSFVHPSVDGTSEYYNTPHTFRLLWANSVDEPGWDILDFYSLTNGLSDAGYERHSNLEFTNFRFSLSSSSEREAKVTFERGIFDFLTPCGETWVVDGKVPTLYFGHFNIDGTHSENPAKGELDSAEFVVESNATLRVPALSIQGNASQNRVTIHGGEHVIPTILMPSLCLTDHAHELNEIRTITDLILDEGARLDCTNAVTLGGVEKAEKRVERISVTDGAWMRICSFGMPWYGEQSYAVDGATLVLGIDGLGSQELQATTVRSVNFSLKNDAVLVLDHKGEAESSNGTGFFFGNVNDIGTHKYFFDCEDSSVEMRASSKFCLYGGKYSFADSCVSTPGSATLQFVGGHGATPGVFVADHTVISNAGTTCVGLTGEMSVTIKNQSKLLTPALVIGGNGKNGDDGGITGSSSSQVSGEINIYDSTVGEIGDSGVLSIGTAYGSAKASLNLYSGSIDFSGSGRIHVGRYAAGEANVYGGKVTAFGIHVGDEAWKSGLDQSGEAESVLRVNGGRVVATGYGEGERFVGGISVGGTHGAAMPGSRKGRLVLGGGVVEAYQIYGGAAAKVRGGTGWAALEADGGTVVPPVRSTCLIECFDEAILGSKGLTIDNAGFGVGDDGWPGDPVVVPQAIWKDRGAEDGRLVLSGCGVTMLTGNVAHVSNLVIAQGYADLTKLDGDNPSPVLNSLIVTNSATLMLNPERTLTLNGGATFGDFSMYFTDDLVKDQVYTLFKSATPLSVDSLRGWGNAFVTRGLPGSCGCDLTQEESGGWYLLKMTVRESESLNISWPHGISNGTAHVSYGVSDTLRVTVGGDDDPATYLTLSGKLMQGALRKLGVGTLLLTNPNNFFAPGIFLDGGCISVNDLSSITCGSYSRSIFEVTHGALEVTGPTEGATYSRQIHMNPRSTNDWFLVKNEVDLAMPCPYGDGTTGSFLKRGKGRLTLAVEDDKTISLCGGLGYGKGVKGAIGAYQGNVIQAKFDENGLPSVPSNGVTSIEVYEGELVFRGKGEDSVVVGNGECIVGHSTQVGAVQPGLVLDSVTFEATSLSNGWVEVGAGVNYSGDAQYARAGDFATSPYLFVTNGAKLVARRLDVARFCDGSDFSGRVLVDGSTLEVIDRFAVNRSTSGTAQSSIVFRNGAKAYVNSFGLAADATLEFDRSVLAADETLSPSKIVSEGVSGAAETATFVFRNGSFCALSEIDPGSLDPTAVHPLTLIFDDSEWMPTTNLFEDMTIEWSNPAQMSLQTENAGLRVSVPDGRTWTLIQPLTGAGGFEKFGSGTFAFGPGAFAYEGVTKLNGGTLSLASAGSAYEMTLSGTGTLYRATLGVLSIRETYLDGENRVEGYPHFSDLVATSGYVDFGRSDLNPLPIAEIADLVVGTYDGTAPDVGGWRVKNTGVANARGEFVCDDGKILLKTIQDGYGTLIITR